MGCFPGEPPTCLFCRTPLGTQAVSPALPVPETADRRGPWQGDILQGPRALTHKMGASLVTCFSVPSGPSRPRRKVLQSLSRSSSLISTTTAGPESALSLKVSPGLLISELRRGGESPLQGLRPPKLGSASNSDACCPRAPCFLGTGMLLQGQ